MDGWIGQKIGQIAGTIGLDKQMEAIQIRIVKNGWRSPRLYHSALCAKNARTF